MSDLNKYIYDTNNFNSNPTYIANSSHIYDPSETNNNGGRKQIIDGEQVKWNGLTLMGKELHVYEDWVLVFDELERRLSALENSTPAVQTYEARLLITNGIIIDANGTTLTLNSTTSIVNIANGQRATWTVRANDNWGLPNEISDDGAGYTMIKNVDGTATIQSAIMNGQVITGRIYCKHKYTVSFNVNGGTVSVNSIEVLALDTITLPSYNGTKTNYTFGGWATGSTIYNAGDTYGPINNNIVFGAVWNQSIIAVTGISLDKTSLTVSANGTGTIKGTITPSNATNKTINWTSSNTSVATVTSSTTSGNNATVTWKGSGTATITAKAAGDNSKVATCNVTCEAAQPATQYYWYVGNANDPMPTEISPIVTDNTSVGWRLIGSTLTNNQQIWDETYEIQIASTRVTQRIIINSDNVYLAFFDSLGNRINFVNEPEVINGWTVYTTRSTSKTFSVITKIQK